MGVVREPRLYKCGVSLNGVVDLPLFLKRKENFIGGRFYFRHIGQLWQDKPSLHRSSPSNSVKSIVAPLMIVASESDLVVLPRQSRRMYNALRKSNNPVEFVELPRGDHFLSREENRQSFAHALLRFLGEHLGKPQQQLAQAISSSQ
jgi:dipeptidyl aminopeptidase/acylaminoacyl peptidase